MRSDLIATWTGLLAGRVTFNEAQSFVDTRIADYGPEELVHSGLLAMNQTARALARGDASPAQERDRFEKWKAELATFDADPAAWNRLWALDYARRTLGSISPRAGRLMIEALSDKITVDDRGELARQFGLDV